MKIFIDNLNYDVSEEFVLQLFSRHGAVREIWLTKTRVGVPHGYGFVHMDDHADAEQAIAKLDGLEFGGRTITVNKARQ